MISMIPVWSPVGFVFLVALLYVLLVSALQHGQHGIKEREKTQLLFPTYARLVLLALLFGTGSATLYGFLREAPEASYRLVYIIGPAILVWGGLLLSPSLHRLMDFIPLHWILLTQMFRIGVEVYLFYFYRWGLMPRAITWEGQNFDVLLGMSAPILAGMYYFMGYRARWTLFAWNLVGIGTVLNAARIGLLAAPTPFYHAEFEPMNRVILFFPYVWLPVFLVPFAIGSHVVALKKIWDRSP